jgi:peptidoglycan/LPS O-acetylase OafA/YrhL
MSGASLANRGSSPVPNLPSRIPSLDGLRAIAIALVIVGHSADSANAPRVLTHFNHLGNFGVRCFFIISGFLITTLLLKEEEQTGSISMKGFYIRRALRIFPASLVFIGVIALCSNYGYVHLNSGDLIHALTYTMNYHLRRAWWFDHLWSLSVEEQFYLIWPGLIWFVGSRRGVKIAWAVVLVVPLIRAFMWFHLHASDSAMTKHFEANADALASGCLLSLNYNRIVDNRWFQQFQASSFFGIVALGFALGGQAIFVLNPASFYIVGQTFANVGTVLCIFWCIRHSGSTFGALLNWRPVVYIGTLSYSLYLWQNAFLNPDWDGWPATFPINIFCAIGMAAASYYMIEKPFLRLKTVVGHPHVEKTCTIGVAK